MRTRHIAGLIYHLIRGVISPDDPKHSVRAGDVLRRAGLLNASVDKLREHDCDRLLHRREVRFDQPAAYFERFPEGSLGHAYSLHLKRNGLDPSVFGPTQITDEAAYLEYLVRQTHDLWHLLTEFDTSIPGELGLQAFMLRQMQWPFALIAIAAGFLVVLFKRPGEAPRMLPEMVRGYELAGRMRPLVLVDWNAHWARPIPEVKAELLRTGPLAFGKSGPESCVTAGHEQTKMPLLCFKGNSVRFSADS